MPTTDFELQEPWFHLIAVTAFTFLPVVLAPIAKMAKVFDKKAQLCGSPFRYIPGIFPVVLYALIHLGLYTTGLFIHINESDPGDDSYFYEINIMTYTIGLILAFVPHLYTLNWYDYSDQIRNRYSKSFGIMTTISGFLTPLFVFAAWALMLAAIVMAGIDERWTAFGLYLTYEVFITIAFLYLVFELIWCANAYRKMAIKSGRSGLTVIRLMEDASIPSDDQDENEPEQGEEMGGRAYGMKRSRARRRNGYSPYGRV
jgi:hypothetical protein